MEYIYLSIASALCYKGDIRSSHVVKITQARVPLATTAFNTQGNETSQKKSTNERKIGKKSLNSLLDDDLVRCLENLQKDCCKPPTTIDSFNTNLVQRNGFSYMVVAQQLFDEHISLSCHLTTS